MRSILKNSSSATSPSLPPQSVSVVDRYERAGTPIGAPEKDKIRDTALYHANLIQHRKDIEASILDSTEALLDLPTTTTDSTQPSDKDASFVRRALVYFQPSDYDSLLQERNINKRCGYVLCPRPNRLEDAKPRFRLVYGAGQGPDAMKIVESRDLERWCSDECGRRALYIKAQLNTEPAWMRTFNKADDLVLFEAKQLDRCESEEAVSSARQAPVHSLSPNGEQELVSEMHAHTLDR